MTATGTNPTIVVVPGLRDHVEDHWQTQLAGEFDKVRTVAPLVHYKISLTEHVAALDDVLRSVEGPVHLVAHSAGVMTAVHWAQNATRNIAGAFLAAPADLDTPLPEGYPTIDELRRAGWTPVPRRELPFPSIVGASTNDPLATFGAVRAFASDWGSALLDLGAVGHLNPVWGYGKWPEGEELIRQQVEGLKPGRISA